MRLSLLVLLSAALIAACQTDSQPGAEATTAGAPRAPRRRLAASPQKRPEAHRAADAACRQGNASACDYLGGAMHLAGVGAEQDDAKAALAFGTACEGGWAKACERLGELTAGGRAVEEDPARARALLARACDGEVGSACRGLGARALEEGDAAAAATWFLAACAVDDGAGCRALAALHLAGTGVTQDRDYAAVLARRACALEDKVACDEIASATLSAAPPSHVPYAEGEK